MGDIELDVPLRRPNKRQRKMLFAESVKAAFDIIDLRKISRAPGVRRGRAPSLSATEARLKESVIRDNLHRLHPGALAAAELLLNEQVVASIRTSLAHPAEILYLPAREITGYDSKLRFAGALSILSTGLDRFAEMQLQARPMWACPEDTVQTVETRYNIYTAHARQSRQYQKVLEAYPPIVEPAVE